MFMSVDVGVDCCDWLSPSFQTLLGWNGVFMMSSASVSFGMMLISCAKSGEVSSSSENAAA